MSGSCCGTGKKFDGMDPQYKKILWIVIAINASMFVVEMLGGALAGSQALKADALDFLGDALTYGISLWAIGKSLSFRANAALLKGASLLLMGAWVLASTIYQFFILQAPVAPVMGSIAVMALLANVTSVLLLMRYKDGDANVRSVWLCSRNDAISNVLVIAASVAVFVTASAWPDLIVAVIMAFIFTRSAMQIIRQALAERREAKTTVCS
ncbi:cation transporter [Salinibius halmophilus]|uniref:cation transporter n=1 Tax=Salinibius halmophilus TaxID=1853216 RepID=UPI000E661C92|nr:cation diffusion facilitator family transporter [Salinibius halmophilus]